MISTERSESTHQLWQNAAWYRALTLSERLPLRQRTMHAQASDPVSEIAWQRLQRWKEQAPFDRDSYFAQRLTLDGLTEEDLLALLDETPEGLQERIQQRDSAPPAWLQELSSAFDDQEVAANFVLPWQHIADKQTRAFLLALKPLLYRGCLRVQAGIDRLVQKHSQVPFDHKTLLPLLFQRLSAITVPKIVKTLVLELNVARLQGKLQGETPQERFKNFLDSLAGYDGMLALYEEYPVLARVLVETIQRWVACQLEFVERLCADWEQIREVLAPDFDPGVLTGISEGVGDVHRDGRSVILATWSSGFRLVYKPHSLATDLHFQEVLTWLNLRGYQPAFRTLKLINKETHGWIEFVQTQGCTSVAEIERFYQRQGGYLALLYILEASDFHAENVIASGEYPMLIDLETLFHPCVGGYEEMMSKVPGKTIMSRSVMRTSMLPQRIWSADDSEGIDASALGGKTHQRLSGISTWTEEGTDQMRLTKGEGQISFAHHRPLLNGQDVDTLEFSEHIAAGFIAFSQLIKQHREAFITEVLPRFAHDETRCLLRPTRHYGFLLADSFHPDVLRDALDRDRLFDRLWIAAQMQFHLPRLIPSERRDLLNDDIPAFSTHPNSRDLLMSRGEVVSDLFEEAGLDMSVKLVRGFDEHEMERQLWVIRASFATLTLGIDGLKRFLNLKPPQREATPERLLTAARAVGDRLQQLAIYSGNAVGWLGVTPLREQEWHVSTTDGALYSGTPGIGLFLGYLGYLTGEKKYTEMARATLVATRNHIAEHLNHPEACSIGAFVGVTSLVYILSHMGTLWNEPALYQEALEIVRQLPALIEQDEIFDVLGGSAGCILSLLSLHAVAPSAEIIVVARQCGDHLLAHIQKMPVGIGWASKLNSTPLSGFSHGNAGIALSLLLLSGVTREERFREAALAAIQYERSLFLPSRGNWRDLRKNIGEDAPQVAEDACMVAWCHGAVGIGLARLEGLPYLDDARVREEIEIALQATLTSGFGTNHSLCHGDMGNMELPLRAAQVLDDPQLQQTASHLISVLLENIEEQGWVTGIPLGIETPGLLTGLAGIGYSLIRWAAPTRVPSVLMQSPPLPPA